VLVAAEVAAAAVAVATWPHKTEGLETPAPSRHEVQGRTIARRVGRYRSAHNQKEAPCPP